MFLFSICTLSLITFVVFLLYLYFARNFSYWKNKNVFYFKPIPFFGNFLDVFLFRTTVGEYLANLYRNTTEPFFGIFVLDTPHLILRSPELIKHILVKDFKYFDNRTIAYNPDQHELLASMLFINQNPEWRILRNKVSPVFTSGKLKTMLPLINECGESMSNYLETKSLEPSTEAKEICAKFSTNVISRCAFGINARCFEDENSEFRKLGKLIFNFNWINGIRQTAHFFLPSLVRFFRLPFVDPYVTTFWRECFWETIKTREKYNIKGNDLIDTIIKIKNSDDHRKELKFEGDKVVAQAGQFFLAGFETTSTTMAFALYELSIHPQIQKRLRSEIKSCLQQYGGFTYEAVQNMSYLHMCVQETLRKYPVLPFLDRRCNEDYTIPGSDVVIEKGTPVYIPMFGIHYDEKYYPDPQNFDPERFSEENWKKLIPYTFLPFGEGPRICIGERFGLLSTKLGLIHILNDFAVEASKDTPLTLEFDPRCLVLGSKVGLPMKFKRAISSAG